MDEKSGTAGVTRTLWNDLIRATSSGGGDIELVEDAVIALEDGRIAFACGAPEVPNHRRGFKSEYFGGLLAETGTIDAGKSADLAIRNLRSPSALVSRFSFNPLHARVFKGRRFAS